MRSPWVTIRTVLIFLFDGLVLQWLKVPLALLFRVAWYPVYGTSLIRQYIAKAPDQAGRGPDINAVPLDALEQDADGAKWLGLLAAGGHEKAWKALLARMDATGIHRYPVGDARNSACPAFSGDMASGLVLAVVRMLKKGNFEGRERVAALFRCIVDRGFSFPGNNTADVGRVYQFFALTPTYRQVLVWLEIACILNPGDRRLAFWRGFVRILFAPILAVNLVDYNIWLCRVVALAWYIPHSQYLFTLAGHELTGEKHYAAALYALRGKYPWNADFHPWRTVLHDFAAHKGTEEYTGELELFLSLRSLAFKEMATEILPPTMLGQKYLHENDPFKPKSCGDDRRAAWPYDALAPHLPDSPE